MKTLSEWTSKKVFEYVHQNYLIYNACWEDPRLDREAMQLTENDEVLLITSAGCNALDYALDQPRHIYAIDLNFRQNALLELKIAGIRRLEFPDFFQLFGEGGLQNYGEIYSRLLRPELTPAARAFWDRRQHYFNLQGPQKSFYRYGTSGVFARWIVDYLKLLRLHSDLVRIFEAASVEEQSAIYSGRIKDRLWRGALKAVLRTDWALSRMALRLDLKLSCPAACDVEGEERC